MTQDTTSSQENTISSQENVPSSTIFEIGPDKGENIQLARSYFLVPLLGLDPNQGSAYHQDRIANAGKGVEYTDIYVFSHGWHRNLFGAVSAYDRLMSRFTSLFQRDRLIPKSVPYRSLFLAMHWDSDPGQDGWVDNAGRRDKSSFLQNAYALFEPIFSVSEGDFLNALEDLYEFMTYVSSPNVPALNNSMTGNTGALYAHLNATADIRGRLATGPPTRAEDKVTLIWRCYEEADAQRVLMDQSEAARPFSSPLQAISNLLKFLVAVLGITALTGLLPKLIHLSPLAALWTTSLQIIMRYLHSMWVGLSHFALILGLNPLTLRKIEKDFSQPYWEWLWLFVFLVGLAIAILTSTMAWHQTRRLGKGGRGLPVLAVGSWLPLQLAFTLPLLLYLFATFLFQTWLILLAPAVYYFGIRLHAGSRWPLLVFMILCLGLSYRLRWHGSATTSLFNERVDDPSQDSAAVVPPRIRDRLATFSRLPVGWLIKAVSQDSQVLGLAEAVDRQLAFWEMQRKAVQAGQDTGMFLKGLFQKMTQVHPAALKDARVHLIGHSFGGLVVANAARYLGQKTEVQIHSLTLLEAALASAWFATEPWCQNPQFLKGALACIFSAYDSANGFYYPAANNGRMAAGYVGLCEVGGRAKSALTLGKDGLFASMVQPPDLSKYLSGSLPPFALNMDASRLIFEGAVASGGGHDDIYKDDVIHMIWAITAL